MDRERVKALLSEISSLTESDLEAYGLLIESAVCSVENMLKGEADSKAELLAAAKANYEIALSQSGTAGVTSFKAGDVSITQSESTAVNSAYLLYKSILGDSSDIINDSAFEFKSV